MEGAFVNVESMSTFFDLHGLVDDGIEHDAQLSNGSSHTSSRLKASSGGADVSIQVS